MWTLWRELRFWTWDRFNSFFFFITKYELALPTFSMSNSCCDYLSLKQCFSQRQPTNRILKSFMGHRFYKAVCIQSNVILVDKIKSMIKVMFFHCQGLQSGETCRRHDFPSPNMKVASSQSRESNNYITIWTN
jgi:hypothetical protein